MTKLTHPGFTIICDKCKSNECYIDSNVGFSDESGAWGSVDIICKKCEASIDIWNA